MAVSILIVQLALQMVANLNEGDLSVDLLTKA